MLIVNIKKPIQYTFPLRLRRLPCFNFTYKFICFALEPFFWHILYRKNTYNILRFHKNKLNMKNFVCTESFRFLIKIIIWLISQTMSRILISMRNRILYLTLKGILLPDLGGIAIGIRILLEYLMGRQLVFLWWSFWGSDRLNLNLRAQPR